MISVVEHEGGPRDINREVVRAFFCFLFFFCCLGGQKQRMEDVLSMRKTEMRTGEQNFFAA